MTVEQADYLIGLDKYIALDGELKKNFHIDIPFPMKFRLDFSSNDGLDQNFFVDISESLKKALKISLHHQDDNTQYGLVRIDFNGRHQNPSEVIRGLPKIFRPYAGRWLDDYSGHIHYVVDGYKPLVWALPLEVDEFPVKSLAGREDYTSTLKAFFNKINVKTKISYNIQMHVL